MIYPFRDRPDVGINVLFYPVPLDTDPSPFPSPFVLRNWERLNGEVPGPIGTDFNYRIPYYGHIPWIAPGVPCGTADQWSNGLNYETYLAGGYSCGCDAGDCGVVVPCCTRVLPNTFRVSWQDLTNGQSGVVYAEYNTLIDPLGAWTGVIRWTVGLAHYQVPFRFKCPGAIHGFDLFLHIPAIFTKTSTCGPPFTFVADGMFEPGVIPLHMVITIEEMIVTYKTGPIKPNAHATSGGVDDLGGGPLPVADGGTGLTAVGAPFTALASDGTVLSWIPAAFIFNGYCYVPIQALPPVGVPAAIPGRAPIVLATTPPSAWAYLGGAWQRLGGGGAPSPGNIEDVFTDANGVGLDQHLIAPTNVPAARWNDFDGVWNIQANSAALIVGPADRFVVADCLLSDRTVSAMVTLGAGDFGGLALRMNDSSNGYFLSISQAGNLAYLIRKIGGGGAVLQTWPVVPPIGVAREVKAVLAADVISTYYNGVLLGSVAGNSFHQFTTTHGLYAFNATVRINDYKCFP